MTTIHLLSGRINQLSPHQSFESPWTPLLWIKITTHTHHKFFLKIKNKKNYCTNNFPREWCLPNFLRPKRFVRAEGGKEWAVWNSELPVCKWLFKMWKFCLIISSHPAARCPLSDLLDDVWKALNKINNLVSYQ